jgi:hypothetical protein
MTESLSAPPPPPEPAPEPAQTLEGAVVRAVLPLMRLLPPPPDGAILTPPEAQEPARRTWFLIQLWAELRLAVRMYFDPRYRLSRTAQLAFPLFAALVVLNYFLFAAGFPVPVVCPVAERLLDVILAALAYRVLLRELDRYRTVLDYLARYQPPR